MVTGDNLQTARAIALECGILDDPNVSEPVIIEGKTFRELSDLEREEAAEKISVCFISCHCSNIALVPSILIFSVVVLSVFFLLPTESSHSILCTNPYSHFLLNYTLQ